MVTVAYQKICHGSVYSSLVLRGLRRASLDRLETWSVASSLQWGWSGCLRTASQVQRPQCLQSWHEHPSRQPLQDSLNTNNMQRHQPAVAVWHSWSHHQSYSTPGPVSTGMVDRIGVQLPVWESYLGQTNHPGQHSLAIPAWVGAMSTGDALKMASKGRYGWCLVAGRTVWSLV